MSSPVFPVNGSLLMAPLFPRSGPGESGSPMSQVVLRCYDFPFTHPQSLICFAPGAHATLLGSCLAACACAPGRPEGAFRAGSLFSRRPNCRLVLTWTRAGSPRFPGDPSYAFASVQDPGRTDDPSPIDGFVDAAPAFSTAKGCAFVDGERFVRIQFGS